MEFNEAELKVSLEATGKRYKMLRSRLMDSGKTSSERQNWEENITNLNSVIKKLLKYRHDNFPQTEEIEATDADSLLATEQAEVNFSCFKILIVDHETKEREQIINVLKEVGFEKFDQAEDGHIAIGLIKDKPTPYDLVISDADMPTLTGLELLTLLRADDKYRAMPFLMISEKGSKSCIENAMAAGVNAYVVKPLNSETLLPKVTRLLT